MPSNMHATVDTSGWANKLLPTRVQPPRAECRVCTARAHASRGAPSCNFYLSIYLARATVHYSDKYNRFLQLSRQVGRTILCVELLTRVNTMQCQLQKQLGCRADTGSVRSFGQRSEVSWHTCSRTRCNAKKPAQERLSEVEGWATKPAEEGLAEAQAWPVKPPQEGLAGAEVWQRRKPSADVWQVREARHMHACVCVYASSGLLPLVQSSFPRNLLAVVLPACQHQLLTSAQCQSWRGMWRRRSLRGVSRGRL